ncbi:MAG TPA: FAD-dependent oxidoreductase [Polyangiaceae bacterium]|nr:FAD-dependent oxidoreductase [Polyangiaceae bacterium]
MEEPRTYVSRRLLIKTVIAGAVEASAFGCKHSERSAPSPGRTAAPPRPTAERTALVHGETFAQGHKTRDGELFPRAAEATESCDVVIIGGGPSGLCAAHLLEGREVILLEKEPHPGGNCSTADWQGVPFSTGAAFYTEGDTELVELMKSVGAPGLPVQGGDSLIVDGKPYFDFFGAGADNLPFSAAVRRDFADSAQQAAELRHKLSSSELDQRPFYEFLRKFRPEIKRFWDRFGESNWGGATEHTSARLGVHAYSWLSGDEKRLTYPGGLGVAAAALARHLSQRNPDQIRNSVFVHQIEVEAGQSKRVLVHTLQNGRPHTIAARAAIVAVPKFFASRIVQPLSTTQRDAMREFRYAPYPVFNVCLKQGGPQPAYDNWFLDAPFADFVTADWVTHAGKRPSHEPSALTVYHPLPEARRSELLDDARLLQMAEDVVQHLDRHFPGLQQQVAEVRVYRRGHALAIPVPGQLQRAEIASRSQGRIVFAHSDSRGDVSSFPGALRAARLAVDAVKKLG